MRSERVPALLLAIVIAFTSLFTASSLAPAATAGPAAPLAEGQLRLPKREQVAVSTSEIDDLLISPIDETMSASEVMRSRPFILFWDDNPAFALDTVYRQPLTEPEARVDLERFLTQREMDRRAIDTALALFDDPAVKAIVGSPSLRAALLYLYQLDPWDAVIDAILNGANDTGAPFIAVEFTTLPFDEAVATIFREWHGGQPRYRLQIGVEYASDSPLQLAPVIVHESLHGDGFNSSEEELTANILDTIAYAELLLSDPAGADSGTELTAFNNVQLYALLNSMGSRGGGHVGIATSAWGDVFVGPGLEEFDAGSIRESILQDQFYGSLESGGFAIPPSTATILRRFPGFESLGSDPVYSEALLGLIDYGVSLVVTPAKARSLAVILGLQITVGSAEATGIPVINEVLSLRDRPFTPVIPGYFDLNLARRPVSAKSVAAVREELGAALGLQQASDAQIQEALAMFDNAPVVAAIPDPQLRGALILMRPLLPWSESVSEVFAFSAIDPQWRFSFGPLSSPVNASFDRSFDGVNQVVLNQFLIGDSLEVTAAAMLEGILLQEDRPSPNGALIAALMSTLAYADLVRIHPDTVTHATWGTISRNRDLLALVNSTAWTPGNAGQATTTIGFLAPANGGSDVFPGLIADARSFQSYVQGSPRVADVENISEAPASGLLMRLTIAQGIQISDGGGGVVNSSTLALIDANLGEFLSPFDVASLAAILELSGRSI